MRIEFSTEGGLAFFPGLSKPVAVEADRLGKDEAERLQRLVEAARFFDLPLVVGSPPPGAADYQSFVLAVDDGARRHTVRVREPVEDPALRDLIELVRKYAKDSRAAQR